MAGIAIEAERLIKEGVEPSRIGIITSSGLYAEALTWHFRTRGIPVNSDHQRYLFDQVFTQKIFRVLQYIAAERDWAASGDALLFEILHFDWFGIPPALVAGLSVESYNKKISIRQLLREKANSPGKDLFSPALDPGLQKASALLEELIPATGTSLPELIEKITQQPGILNDSSQDRSVEIVGLSTFIQQQIQQYPSLDLRQLIALPGMMHREGDKGPVLPGINEESGVRLLRSFTETGFDHVLLAIGDNTDNENLKNIVDPASTNIQQQLIITCNNPDEETRINEFAKNLSEQHGLTVNRIESSDLKSKLVVNELLYKFPLDFTADKLPEIESPGGELVNRQLQKFVLSVSSLSNYLNCPLEFYFRNIIRVPSPPNEAAGFGSSVHFALERMFRKMQDGRNDQFITRDEFITDFRWCMQQHRECFNQEQFDRRIGYGEELLGNYYDRYIGTFKTVVAIERNIRVVIDDVPIKGILDKLEFDGKLVNIVDYKTGDPDKALKRMKPPHEEQPNGGDYWRQAVFYKILVDNYEQKGWRAVSTEFDFIEPDQNKNYRREKLAISSADVTTVTAQIRDAWQKIQQRDFFTGCGRQGCYWCDFVRSYVL